MKTFFTKHFGLKLLVAFLVLTSVFSVLGASGDVDPGFNPQLTVDVSNQGGSLLIQPDGKIIIYGSYGYPGGGGRTYVKRLNSDGSTDTTFDCHECRLFQARSVGLQPDGKILIGGKDKLIRVNQDGSLDSSFTSPFNTTNLRCETKLITVQPDGKSLVTCVVYNSSGLVSHNYVIRLNNDGSADTTFTTIIPPPNQFVTSVLKIVVLPDNRILVGGGQYGDTGGWLNRYNSDGSLDNSFQAPNAYSNGRISEIELQPDGKYLVGAYFKIYRLFSDGNTDTSFSPITVGQYQYMPAVKFLSDGRIYAIVVTNNSFPTPSVANLVRYNANGSTDGSFNPAIVNSSSWTVDSSGRILVSQNGFFRLNLDGTIDSSFNTNISGDGYVNAVAVQSDGKMILIGEFSKTNGFNSGRITRINQDGTTDTSFITGSGFDVAPKGVSIQPDGKILVSGRFGSYNGTPRSNTARLNADGSLDMTFSQSFTFSNTNFQEVSQIVYLPNGKIMIGGSFSAVNGEPRTLLAILNSDGSLDMSFNPTLPTDQFSTIRKIYIQSNGQIMVTGHYGVKRFNADGTLDNSFENTNFHSIVTDVIQRADGKYIISIVANSYEFNPSLRLLNNNGTINSSFNATASGQSSFINTVFEQPNGNIVYGGRFSFVGERINRNIARVTASGAADLFFPTYGTNGTVNSIFGQPDGKIIFVGEFNTIENVGRSGIARLTLSNRIRGTLFDFDGDGRSDVSVFRPSTNTWYSLLSGSSSVGIQNFGANGDIPVPADYDGDGKTDLGIFRPSTGDWIYILSKTNTVFQYNWGLAGDIPLPALGGDGKARPVVYRPSNNNWYGIRIGAFGTAGDKPLTGDFDGDGVTDAAVYRPSTGTWWYAASSASYQQRAAHWGIAEDIPAPGDYDGDGTTDFAVFRPSSSVWYILNSTGGYTILTFGLPEDKPVPADYDGDGKTDIAVFRPSTGIWYLLQSTSGFGGVQWGISTDIPIQNAFIH